MDLDILYAIHAEFQKAREEEKRMNGLKQSFEKQLQNERTLKIQVCVCTPTQVCKAWSLFFTFLLLYIFSQTCSTRQFVICC